MRSFIQIGCRSLIFIFLFGTFSNCSPKTKVIQGHAHNDYKNENPLQDALKNGFTSVEVDVHLINAELYVSHETPDKLHADNTLENLYLKPLLKHINKNSGHVYSNYSGMFYLMVDIKTDAKTSYEKLKSVLSNYISMLSVVNDGEETNGRVKVYISGNRPIEIVLNETQQLVGLDGRPAELTRNISSQVMPVVSDKYSNFLSWDGYSDVNQDEKIKFLELVKQIHLQNKKLRLWASPDNENTWKFLLENGVDLINTDQLERFKEFVNKYNQAGK